MAIILLLQESMYKLLQIIENLDDIEMKRTE